MSRNKNVSITSPVGTAVYPWLNEPDTKFDSGGVYKVELRMDNDHAAPFIKEIRQVLEDAIKESGKKNPKTAPLPIKDDFDEDGNPTGNVLIKFKMKAVGGSGAETWEQRPQLLDAQLKPMKEKIGGGSLLRVGCEVVPYNNPSIGVGVTLRMKVVQCLKLKEIGGSNLEVWEFSKTDGFVTSGETNTDSLSEVPPSDEDHDF